MLFVAHKILMLLPLFDVSMQHAQSALQLFILFTAVYRVLEELKYKHYNSQMERYLQLFHHRPVAASLYRKVLAYKKVNYSYVKVFELFSYAGKLIKISC